MVLAGELSKSSRAWDLDGDGQLDDAELALKAMDKERTGDLSKEQLYGLMTDNLNTQRELFKMKKVVMALAGITCILALSNLGTSFAAAILSKDTMASHGALVEKSTGLALKTDSWTNIVHEDKEATDARRQRRLQDCEAAGDGLACVFHGHLVTNADALSMLASCMSGSDVDVQFTHEKVEGTHLESFCICGEGHNADYTLDPNDETVAIAAIIEAGGHTYKVVPDPDSDTHYVVNLDEAHGPTTSV